MGPYFCVHRVNNVILALPTRDTISYCGVIISNPGDPSPDIAPKDARAKHYMRDESLDEHIFRGPLNATDLVSRQTMVPVGQCYRAKHPHCQLQMAGEPSYEVQIRALSQRDREASPAPGFETLPRGRF